MSKYGEFMDVYIPSKRMRNGLRLCFVHFRGIGDVQRLLNDVIQIYVATGKLRASVARERRSTRQTQRLNWGNPTHHSGGVVDPTKTYTSAVAPPVHGKQPPALEDAPTGNVFIPTSDTLSWLSRCIVGILRDPRDMAPVHQVWGLHGLDEVVDSELGGSSILAYFPTQGDRAEDRRCWVSVRGVPLQTWCQEFFELVGSQFGRLIRVHPHMVSRGRVDEARIEVITLQGTMKNKTLEVVVSGQRYSVAVVESYCGKEQDWSFDVIREESEEDEDDIPEEPAGDKVEAALGSGTAEHHSSETDPFNLMPIINQGVIGAGRDVVRSERKVYNQGTHPSLITVDLRDHGISLNQDTHLIVSVVRGKELVLYSNSVPNFNSFGPLDVCEGSEDSSSDEPEPTNMQGLVVCTHSVSRKSNTRSSTSKGYESSPRNTSIQSPSTEYLEKRLDYAIKSGRVDCGRKFKKIKKTDSLTSSNSSTNDDIRRVNNGLSQGETAEIQTMSSVSFIEQEARETVEVGHALGWTVLGPPEAVVSLAQDLIEKEVHEWSQARVHV
ncbi:hypothetical protein Tsubulata_039826 [Turnera subulata]|uniref:DUF4283 domain-containing protein n=1 Tax=Turnera subulata TaxID=218843 RepID=A0A9Q0G2P0_9ROSI|nr:hypothetical protein Tsubulata_039826 [Turnera subulata]